MTASSEILEQLIDDHLAGRPVQVPPPLREAFQQAVAAHAALRGVLDETLPAGEEAGQPRVPPDVSGAYDIERELGRGGMGVVYLARQRSLNRRVALKVLRPGERTFGPLVKRFLEEARHLAQLRHPNIVSIHEVGDADGEPYFTMDYIDGESLSSVLARGPLTPTRAVGILKQVAAAIQHAHQQGIIHRDLKPGNVLLDQSGTAYVSDFGLARNISQDAKLTQSGELLGTPQYMSPEQARGQTSMIGEATDIHALGLLLFEMLTGRSAFGSISPADVLVRLLNEEPPSLRAIDRRIPRDLETICLKALQKSPAARYANVSALLEDLRRYEAGEPLQARRTSLVTRLLRWSGRHWRIATTAVVTAAVVGLIAPRVFDKSLQELVEWGDDELRAGRPQVAAQVYERALGKSTDAEREQVVQRLVGVVPEIDDPKQAVDLALRVLPLAPRASFRKYDFLVAQAVVTAAREEMPGGVFEPLHGPSSPTLELAARRLAVFLEGPWGSPEERRDAEGWLHAIRSALVPRKPLERWSADEIVQLPDEEPDKLRRRSHDATLSPWDRGKAAFAMGRLYETKGDKTAAVENYRTALAEMRKVFPFLAGIASDRQAGRHAGRDANAPECQLLSDVVDALRRLDPAFTESTDGGVRLSFDHPELIPGMETSIMIEMSDPSIAEPSRGLPRDLSRHVPLIPGASGVVRLLNGTYRLRFAGTARSWLPAEDVDPRLVDITAEKWPQEVRIEGQVLDLPPLTVRKLQRIPIVRPAPSSRVDWSRDRFAWEPVAEAATYRVQFGRFVDDPAPTANWFVTTEVTDAGWEAGDLRPHERTQLIKHWTDGTQAGIRVEAFNEAGQRIGVSLTELRFLIVAGSRSASLK